MEYDVHTILDMLTLTATAWVIYTMYMKLKSSYQADKDTLLEAYIVCSSSPVPILASPPCTLSIAVYTGSSRLRPTSPSTSCAPARNLACPADVHPAPNVAFAPHQGQGTPRDPVWRGFCSLDVCIYAHDCMPVSTSTLTPPTTRV